MVLLPYRCFSQSVSLFEIVSAGNTVPNSKRKRLQRDGAELGMNYWWWIADRLPLDQSNHEDQTDKYDARHAVHPDFASNNSHRFGLTVTDTGARDGCFSWLWNYYTPKKIPFLFPVQPRLLAIIPEEIISQKGCILFILLCFFQGRHTGTHFAKKKYQLAAVVRESRFWREMLVVQTGIFSSNKHFTAGSVNSKRRCGESVISLARSPGTSQALSSL